MIIEWLSQTRFMFKVGGPNGECTDPYIGTKPGVTLEDVESDLGTVEVKKVSGGWTHYKLKGTFKAGTQKNPNATGSEMYIWNPGPTLITATLAGDLSNQTDAKACVTTSKNGNPIIDAAPFKYNGFSFGDLASPLPEE